MWKLHNYFNTFTSYHCTVCWFVRVVKRQQVKKADEMHFQVYRYCILTYLEDGNQKCIMFVFCAFKLQSGGKTWTPMPACSFFFFVSNKLSHLRVRLIHVYFLRSANCTVNAIEKNKQIHLCLLIWSKYLYIQFNGVYSFFCPLFLLCIYMLIWHQLLNFGFILSWKALSVHSVLRWALLLSCKYF